VRDGPRRCRRHPGCSRGPADPGVFHPSGTYRVPDLAIVAPDRISSRGLEGAELVVEVLSPDDESRDKFPFYASVGVREIWLVEPANRATEVFELIGSEYRAIPFVEGVARSPVLGIELRVESDRLELRDGDERAVI
jgi:Uma2 family endonuclease